MTNKLKHTGKVIEALPGINFRIQFDNFPEKLVTCYLSGRMRKNHITVLVGDVVEVESVAEDLSTGRIVRRK